MGQLKSQTRAAPRLSSKKSACRKPKQSVKKQPKRSVAAETLFDSALGRYELRRYPLEKHETLRAWDAADEYCLQYLVEQDILPARLPDSQPGQSNIVILNDAFGGLSIPLHPFHPVVFNDSCISQSSIKQNLRSNAIESADISLCHSLDDIGSSINGPADVVLLKIPKNNALLEYQLHQLRLVINANTVLIAAGMTRHIHNSTLDLFSRIIGPTHTTLARKKSRLILSRFDPELSVPDCPYPSTYRFPFTGKQSEHISDVKLINHAAVFSGSKPDIGTRFFLQHLVIAPDVETIVDLGCGNGIVGIAAALMNDTARVIFTDESYMAVESARMNFIECFDGTRDAEFLQTDSLSGIERNSVDMILCNPPFHQDHVITDSIAWRMFSQSLEKLRNGGELWVIGNRHLDYHAKLGRLFGNVEVMASNQKFSILKTVRGR